MRKPDSRVFVSSWITLPTVAMFALLVLAFILPPVHAGPYTWNAVLTGATATTFKFPSPVFVQNNEESIRRQATSTPRKHVCKTIQYAFKQTSVAKRINGVK